VQRDINVIFFKCVQSDLYKIPQYVPPTHQASETFRLLHDDDWVKM